MPIAQVVRMVRGANANKGRFVRALANTGKNGFWALADQGVSSLGSFGINILLARELAVRSYGSFGMLFELMWFLNSLQAALIIYPLTVKGAMVDRKALARLAGACVFLTACLAPICGGAALIMGGVIATWTVGAWAALAAVMWQIQETTRRSLMAELRFRDAIWGDSVSFLGQVAAVAVLAWMGRPTLEGVFQMMAMTSAVAAVIQYLQLRAGFPSLREIGRFAREGWKLSRWLLAGNLSGVFTNTGFTINFAFWQGQAMVGVAFAMTNLLRLTNPLMFAIMSLITPNVARTRATEGLAASKRVFLKFAALGAAMLAPYLAVLIFLPGPVIRFVLRKEEYQQYWLVLVLSAITQGLIYIGAVMGTYLNAVERSRRAFIGQVVYSGMFVVVGFPATAVWGIWGAAVSGIIAASVQVIINFWSIRSLPDAETPPVAADPQRGFEVITDEVSQAVHANPAA